MEIPLTITLEKILIVFKIDLIVWKCIADYSGATGGASLKQT